MAANLSGTLNVFRALVQPRLIVPHLTVKSIRTVDWRALKHAGYVGAVFDKDNCLTRPYDDRLVPEIKDAWEECKEVFGRDNVLIVSNSAGTQSDAGLIQAESVSHHLGVPVLAHKTKKPGCIKPILKYFSDRHPLPPSNSPSSSSAQSPSPHARTSPTFLSRLLPSPPPPSPKIIVVGDRLFTDVLMANRMGSPALAIWTTGLWVKESMFLRALEGLFLGAVLRWRGYRRRKEVGSGADALPDPNLELERRLVKRTRKDHHLEKPVQVIPRTWYTRYTLAALGSSWSGLRWVVGRLTEGRAAREARKAKKGEVNHILQGDREYASRPDMVQRLLVWVKTRRVSENSKSPVDTGAPLGSKQSIEQRRGSRAASPASTLDDALGGRVSLSEATTVDLISR